MPATSPTSDPRPATDPYVLLCDAVRWAQAQGIPIVTGPAGMYCASTHARRRWRRDPFPSSQGVSPLGAAILRHQPDTSDVEVAARLAIGAGETFTEGVADGLEKQTNKRLGAAPDFRLYLAGLEVGTRLRSAIMTVVCDQHGPYLRGEPCPLCDTDTTQAGDAPC